MRMIKWIFQPPPQDNEKLIREVVNWSQTARRGGLLSLEGYVAQQKTRSPRKPCKWWWMVPNRMCCAG
jgi:chemotaxis protein MotA